MIPEYNQSVFGGSSSETPSYLLSDELRKKVLDGLITVGMLRPRVSESVNFDALDVPGILEQYIERLGINSRFPILFDRQSIEAFYADVKPSQQQRPPEVDMTAASRWEEFARLMTSAPTRVLLLESGEANAVALWREQIGHWNIEAGITPLSLRSRFGVHNHNNLFHGSDSTKNVERELDIIIGQLGKTTLLQA